jgi:hypothetical protein
MAQGQRKVSLENEHYATVGDLAKLTGKSSPTIRNRCEKVTKHKTLRGTVYTTAEALEAIYAPDEATIDFQRERALSEKCRRETMEIDLAIKKGKLVPFDQTMRAILELIHAAKSKLLCVPGNVALELSAMDDPNRVELVLQTRIEEALEEIANFDPKEILQRCEEVEASGQDEGDEDDTSTDGI